MPNKPTVRKLVDDHHSIKLQSPRVRAACRPHAAELFTTALSHLTPAPPTTYPSLEPNYSPAPQRSARFGDLFIAESREIPGIWRHPTRIYSPRVPNTR